MLQLLKHAAGAEAAATGAEEALASTEEARDAAQAQPRGCCPICCSWAICPRDSEAAKTAAQQSADQAAADHWQTRPAQTAPKSGYGSWNLRPLLQQKP